MALAVDATSSGSAAATSCTVSHTVSGSDRLIYACCSIIMVSSSDTITATYNGAAMTEVATGAQSASGDTWVTKIFRRIAPDTGAHDIVVSTDNAGGAHFAVGGISFTGGNQSSPEGSAVEAEGSSSPATVNVSSASDEIVIDAVLMLGTAGLTPGGGQTGFASAVLASAVDTGASYETGSGTTTMSWTSTDTAWQIAAIPVKPSAGGGGEPTPFRAPGILVRRSSRNFVVN